MNKYISADPSVLQGERVRETTDLGLQHAALVPGECFSPFQRRREARRGELWGTCPSVTVKGLGLCEVRPFGSAPWETCPSSRRVGLGPCEAEVLEPSYR